LSVAGHSLTAVYAGDASFTTSTSAALSQTVNKAATTSALASNANPAVWGQSVTLTATLGITAPGAGTPSGTVTFKDGATTLGTGTVSGGVASFTSAALRSEGRRVAAIYGGGTSSAHSN